MKELEVKLKNKGYKIFIEENVEKKIGKYLKSHTDKGKVAIITDYNVERLYGSEIASDIGNEGFETKIISVEPCEESKSLDTLKSIYEELSKFKITRADFIIAFGGGVVGDLAGFAASTYLRGIRYIQVPTSLLAQIDSSIGGKTAVNLPWGKNLVGSFYNPLAVFIDPVFLRTLEKRFLHDGLAEMIKYGCIKDRTIIEELNSFKDDAELLEKIEPLIYKCCNIKKSLVESDEKDFGKRMLLNFGHTFGHAIEMYYNYGKYTHGEAVAIGMVHITEKSEKLGITEGGTSNTIKNVLKKYGLPFEMPDMERDIVKNAIMLDKKNMGDIINMVVLEKTGKGIIRKVKADELDSFI